MDALRRAYAKVARTYAERLYTELAGKPFDRQLLTDCASRWQGAGTICDLGCGPGHIGAFLADAGCRVVGLDLSEQMIAVARSRRPDLEFGQVDMLNWGAEDEYRAIVAFYSIVHFAAGERRVAAFNMHRALRPGGEALLAFHVAAAEGGAEEVVHQEDWWQTGAALDFYLHPVEAVIEDLLAVGFESVTLTRRAPYAPEIEAQTERAYLLAVRSPG